MSKIWYVSFLIAAGFLITNIVISVLLVRNRLDSQNFGKNFSQLKGEVKTDIYPQHDFINIVIVALKNPGLANKEGYKIELTDDKGVKVREFSFSGYNVGDPSDLKFQFEPIPQSSGRKYTLAVKEFDSTSDPIFIDINDKGEIAYRIYYRNINKKEVISGLFKELGEKLSNNAVFFILWLGVLAISIKAGTENAKN